MTGIPSEAVIAFLLREASDQHLRTLDEWARQSPENQAMLDALEELWAVAEAVPTPTPSSSPVSVEEIIARAERPSDAGVPVTSVGPATGRPRAKRFVGSQPLGWGLAAAAIGGLLVGSALTVSMVTGLSGDPDAVAFLPHEFRTGAGEVTTMTLGDGSVIRLAPASSLTFDRESRSRTVHLDGEAFFAVDANVQRPFRVLTAAGEATVVGTRFNARATSERLELAVVEGEVIVSSAERRATLSRDQVGRVVAGHEPEVESVDDIFGEIAWLGNFLALSSTRVVDVVTELNRRLDLTVQIKDDALRERTLTGSFAGDSHTEVVAAICLAAGAMCSIRDQTVVMEVAPRRGRSP